MDVSDFVIHTHRSTLRPLTVVDSDEVAERVLADPHVTKTLVDDWSSIEKCQANAREWIESSQTWNERRYGIWGVYVESGRFGDERGLVGIAAASEELPEIGEGPEIYYAFRRSTWGCGLGTEVTVALLQFLFHSSGVSAVEALYYPHINPASLRIAERLGFRFVTHYPFLEYIDGDHRPTVRFDLWLIAHPDNPASVNELTSAATRIGMCVGEGGETFETMQSAILKAARLGGFVNQLGAARVERTIGEALKRGMDCTGFLVYRLRRADFKERP